jgi:hypothetical protein
MVDGGGLELGKIALVLTINLGNFELGDMITTNKHQGLKGVRGCCCTTTVKVMYCGVLQGLKHFEGRRVFSPSAYAHHMVLTLRSQTPDFPIRD